MSRKTVARVTPPPDTLRELSTHVAYEVEMLIGSATRLLETQTGLLDRRAHAESFMLHARQLHHFFYRTPPQEIDVSPSAPAPPLYAVDYVPDWETRRPARPQVLETLARDVGRRVAHLTLDRIVGQEYPVLEAARALLELIRTFRDAAPPDFTADLGPLTPPWDAARGFVYGGRGVTTTSAPVEGVVILDARHPGPGHRR
jgi:hypothetical protein